ncbi:potassium channel family protein [Blastococcus sp. SYSU DS0828]
MNVGASVVAVGTGLLVSALVTWDVVSTTLTIGEGAGPLTRRVLTGGWRRLLRRHRRSDGRRARQLTAAGPLLMVTTVVLWVTLFWAGWSLVFLGAEAVGDADPRRPASVLDTIYFAGTEISTLGVGDFVATTPTWRVAAAVAAFSGLALMTLAITYLFSVMSAVVSRRALATQLHAQGGTAEEMVLGCWDGDRFSPVLTQQLLQLPAQLASLAEQHLAYPVLHFFRSRRPEAAAPLAIARLDDALLLLESAVAAPVRPPVAAVAPVRRVIDRYLSTAGSDHPVVPDDGGPPPPPCTDRLAAAGVPLVDAHAWQGAVDRAAGRRARLRRLVEDAGWEWDVPGPA